MQPRGGWGASGVRGRSAFVGVRLSRLSAPITGPFSVAKPGVRPREHKPLQQKWCPPRPPCPGECMWRCAAFPVPPASAHAAGRLSWGAG